MSISTPPTRSVKIWNAELALPCDLAKQALRSTHSLFYTRSKETTMNKKIALSIAILLLAGLLLAGCGGLTLPPQLTSLAAVADTPVAIASTTTTAATGDNPLVAWQEALEEIAFWFGKDAQFDDNYIRTDHLAMFGEI